MFPLFKGKTYGSVTVGERGQVVIPASLRKEFNIRPGEQLMVFSTPDRKAFVFMAAKELTSLLERAERAISKLESKVASK